MTPLSKKILNSTQKPALMTHVVAGFPSIEQSKEIVRMMDRNGADVIEIQIPFSDPVADGPTMMLCNEKALEKGVSVDQSFEMAKELSAEIDTPLLFMTYFNIVYKRGVQKFCSDAKAVGVQGLIIPDMPIDEEIHEHLIEECKKNDLAWIPVVSPLSDEARIKALSEYANGFWYVVSRTGVTGAQDEFSESTQQQIEYIRKYSDLPISLAFGVSKKEHLDQIGDLADMAVIGSAVQNIFLREEKSFKENLKEAEGFLGGLR